MDFSDALLFLKKGVKVAREGWNGKNMCIMYALNGEFTIPTETPSEMGKRFPLEPFIVMKTADNKFVPWLASQTDLLADDWIVVG